MQWAKSRGGSYVLLVTGIVILVFSCWKLFPPTENSTVLLSPLAEPEAKIKKVEVLAVSKSELNKEPQDINVQVKDSLRPKLDSQAIAYLVYDKTNDQILYAREISKKLPIASITKIMTAIIVLENIPDLDIRIVVPESAIAGESTMGLSPKESIRVEDLLYGMLLPSGNDAAETLAYGTFGDRARFVSTMNKKAQELEMYETWFVNPTGLDEKTLANSSHSTALDLLILANYALENDKFKEIVATKERIVRYTPEKHKAFFLYNRLSLDNAYPAIKGIKPGTSEFAGNTVVSYSDNAQQEYIIIILNSIGLRTELVNMYKILYGQ